jgi:hypothetical protein
VGGGTRRRTRGEPGLTAGRLTRIETLVWKNRRAPERTAHRVRRALERRACTCRRRSWGVRPDDWGPPGQRELEQIPADGVRQVRDVWRRDGQRDARLQDPPPGRVRLRLPPGARDRGLPEPARCPAGALLGALQERERRLSTLRGELHAIGSATRVADTSADALRARVEERLAGWRGVLHRQVRRD